MKNKDLILLLVDKSVNAFGQVMGLNEEAKLKIALTIIQNTIQDSFEINSNYLSGEILADILAKKTLSIDQASLLTNLLWTEAEILLKLRRPQYSLTQYENALQLLHWKAKQSIEKDLLERNNKIRELESIIKKLKLPNEIML